MNCCPGFLSYSHCLYLPVWEAVRRDVTHESGGGAKEDGIVCVCECVCVDGVLMGGGMVRSSERMGFGVSAHAPLNEHMGMSVV